MLIQVYLLTDPTPHNVPGGDEQVGVSKCLPSFSRPLDFQLIIFGAVSHPEACQPNGRQVAMDSSLQGLIASILLRNHMQSFTFVCVRVRVCMCACVHVCVCVCACPRAKPLHLRK